MFVKSSYPKNDENKKRSLLTDIRIFLTKNSACVCNLAGIKFGPQASVVNVFQIRGQLKIRIPQSGKDKFFGFKFLLPPNYPEDCPKVFLDG